MIDAKGGDYWNGWQDYVVKQLLGRGLIGESDLRLYKITDDVDEAVREVTHFYNNYHSMRYFRDDIVLRLQRAPNSEQLEQINRDFADILLKGQYRTSAPLPIEKDEPALDNLARLVFAFNRRDHGRLRILIDHLNDLP
jgi:hypothetical protein